MKLKLNKLHIVGLAVLAVGIGILIFGMTVLYKYNNMRDIKELNLDDLKKGMYVKGTLTTVVRGFPLNADDTIDSAIPLDLYTTQSQDTTDPAYLTYFLVELEEGSQQFVCVKIDEFLYTDFYYQLYNLDETPFEFEGIVTYSKQDEELIKNSVGKIGDYYSMTYYERRRLETPTVDNVSPCCISVRYLGARRLWWLYSIPFLFAGISVFILGGRPFERIK